MKCKDGYFFFFWVWHMLRRGLRRMQNNSLPGNFTPTLHLQICKRPGFSSCQSPPASSIWGKRLNLSRYQFPDLSSETVGKDDLVRVHFSGSRRGSIARCTGEAKVTSCLAGGHRCGLEREVVVRRCRCAGNGSFLGLEGLVDSHCKRFWWECQVPRPPGVSSGLTSRQELFKKEESCFQSGQGASAVVFLSELHSASHLPQKFQAGSEGLAPDGAISCSGSHSKLGASYISVYVAGATHPVMGYIASKIQRLSKNYATF